MRNFNNWDEFLAGAGTAVYDGRFVTLTAMGLDRAYIRRHLWPEPGSVVRVRVLARKVSGDPRIIIDFPGFNDPVNDVDIDSEDLQEYTLTYKVPIHDEGGRLTVNIGVFRDESGTCDVFDPIIEVNGVDIDTTVISESTPTGGYIQYPSGLLHAWADDLTFERTTNNSLRATWDLPVPFIGSPSASYSVPDLKSILTGFTDHGSFGVLRTRLDQSFIFITRVEGAPEFPVGSKVSSVQVQAMGKWR